MSVRIVKRNGESVEFLKEKVDRVVSLALGETNETIEWSQYEKLLDDVCAEVKDGMSVEDVSNLIEKMMMKYGLYETSKRFILYRHEHAELRNKGWDMTDLQRDIYNKKYRYNNESFEQFLERVSGGDQYIKKLIKNKKFLFGGRTLANRGIDNGASFSNCYTEGRVGDSMDDIMETAKNLALTYKAQGGEGLSITNIRPKGSPIGDSGFTSDGFVPFMEIFDVTTSAISQGGSRKGALLISCDVEHKDIYDFITIKSDASKITKANLSVEISNRFMDAVDKYYSSGEVTKLHIVKEYGNHVIEYDITPIEVYKSIIKHAYLQAEPGVMYMERFQNYNLMEFIDEYIIECSNACGEQPMPKFLSCNLSSINLAEYIKDGKFDMKSFKEDIPYIVRAMDDVLKEGADRHALPQQREAVKRYNNIGIGFMGLGTLFLKLGITYGSQESKDLLKEISTNLFREAVIASSNLANERGVFPAYDDKIFDSQIIKKHFTEDEINELKKNGLRNSSLISVAPNGSIGNLFGVTGGIEPEFAFEYTRKTESLHGNEEVYYTVYAPIAKEYMEKHNVTELPEYFVTSENIKWWDRIDIQAIAQESTDTAISSTVNLPVETKLEDVEQLYLYAWKKGLKGTTIFYAGGNRQGILTTGNKKPNKPENLDTIESIEDKMLELEIQRSELASKKYQSNPNSCPICGGMIKHVGGCEECVECSWSPCGV